MDTRADNRDQDPIREPGSRATAEAPLPGSESGTEEASAESTPAAAGEPAAQQPAAGEATTQSELGPEATPAASRERAEPQAGFDDFDDEEDDYDFDEVEDGSAEAGGPFAESVRNEDELSLSEASELVGVSARALRDRVQRGSLPAHKVTREGRVLSVVRRTDLMKVYGWMVAEGERKQMAEPSGAARAGRVPIAPPSAGVAPTGPATFDLRRDVSRLQGTLSELLAQLDLQRQDQVRQRELELRARREHEREVARMNAQAELLANEIRELRQTGRRDKPAWELIGAVLLLVVVVCGLWIHFQGAESARQRQFDLLREEILAIPGR